MGSLVCKLCCTILISGCHCSVLWYSVDWSQLNCCETGAIWASCDVVMYCGSITKSMTNCHPLAHFWWFADVGHDVIDNNIKADRRWWHLPNKLGTSGIHNTGMTWTNIVENQMQTMTFQSKYYRISGKQSLYFYTMCPFSILCIYLLNPCQDTVLGRKTLILCIQWKYLSKNICKCGFKKISNILPIPPCHQLIDFILLQIFQ